MCKDKANMDCGSSLPLSYLEACFQIIAGASSRTPKGANLYFRHFLIQTELL
jgi:hypothetical protein